MLKEGRLSFSNHAYEAMEKRSLVEQDVCNCLWAGRFAGCEFESRSWRYRVETPEGIVVVVAFRSSEHAVVVTTWRD